MEELRHFDVLLLRYLRRVNSELCEQAVNVSLHQICEGADSGAPSLNNFFPTCTLSLGNPPGLFGFSFSFFSIFLGLLRSKCVPTSSLGCLSMVLRLSTCSNECLLESSFFLFQGCHTLLHSRQL